MTARPSDCGLERRKAAFALNRTVTSIPKCNKLHSTEYEADKLESFCQIEPLRTSKWWTAPLWLAFWKLQFATFLAEARSGAFHSKGIIWCMLASCFRMQSSLVNARALVYCSCQLKILWTISKLTQRMQFNNSIYKNIDVFRIVSDENDVAWHFRDAGRWRNCRLGWCEMQCDYFGSSFFFDDVLGIALWETSFICHGVVVMMMNRVFHCLDATAAMGGVDIKWIFNIFELFIPTAEGFLSARWCLPFPPFVSLNSKNPLMDVRIVVTNQLLGKFTADSPYSPWQHCWPNDIALKIHLRRTTSKSWMKVFFSNQI